MHVLFLTRNSYINDVGNIALLYRAENITFTSKAQKYTRMQGCYELPSLVSILSRSFSLKPEIHSAIITWQNWSRVWTWPYLTLKAEVARGLRTTRRNQSDNNWRVLVGTVGNNVCECIINLKTNIQNTCTCNLRSYI